MYKRIALWAVLLGLALYACLQTPLLNALFTLLILGIIPGTDMLIPRWVAIFSYPLLILFICAWLMNHTMFIGEGKKPVRPAKRSGATTSSIKKPSRGRTTHKRRAKATV